MLNLNDCYHEYKADFSAYREYKYCIAANKFNHESTVMTTAATATQSIAYFSNLAYAADNLIGALLSVKPSEFAAWFREARAMSLMAGGEGSSISIEQMQ